MLDSFFKLNQHQTTVKAEVIAGITTFAAMSYVLIVNPGILGASGMPTAGLITVTALAACIGTLMMALMTNYPIALAPGMGLNAFFAFTVCLTREVPWEAALGLVFWNGILFVLLSVTGVRTKIAEAIPPSLKVGVQCGIGLFIAFIGLQNAGLVVNNEATLVTIGDLSDPGVMLSFLGIIFVAAMVVLKINSGIVISVLLLTIIGLFIPTENGTLTSMPSSIVGLPNGIGDTFMAMDLMYPFRHFGDTWDIIFAMVFVNMFDTIGTLLGVSRKAGLLDKNGKLPKMGGAMTADAASSIAGAAFGTSPVTSYAESAAGISAGGRTGLTGVVVAICFLLALFLTPLIQVIPMMATTPALVIVGVIMMDSIRQIDFDDLAAMSTAVVALMAMPLTFSISEGIALGFIVYVGVKLATGKYKEVTWITYALAAVFMARYLLDLK